MNKTPTGGKMESLKTSAICGEYTSQQCPVCKEWIYVDGGPFSDDKKPLAGARHVQEEHPEVCVFNTNDEGHVTSVQFPYLKWNKETVEAWIPNELVDDLRAKNPCAF
jgi:hypothetical protein|tara:strand:+ start:806 stop:1129 length:324 start_codon:yes stop_codon:yes gene_type:complete